MSTEFLKITNLFGLVSVMASRHWRRLLAALLRESAQSSESATPRVLAWESGLERSHGWGRATRRETCSARNASIAGNFLCVSLIRMSVSSIEIGFGSHCRRPDSVRRNIMPRQSCTIPYGATKTDDSHPPCRVGAARKHWCKSGWFEDWRGPTGAESI